MAINGVAYIQKLRLILAERERLFVRVRHDRVPKYGII